MELQIGLVFNANSNPMGRGVDMPYVIIDIMRTYNHKGELVKTMYIGEIDLGEGLKGKSEFTDDQINTFRKAGK